MSLWQNTTDKMKEEVEKSNRKLFLIIGVINFFGLFLIVFYALHYNVLEGFRVISVAAMLAIAFSMLGFILGLIFGIPRSEQEPTTTPANSNNTDKIDSTSIYRPNTNLEQISDWLTKILVGVGLTELKEIPKHLEALANFLSPGLGNNIYSPRFALALASTYFISGFLLGYLVSRLHLATAFREADIKSLFRLVDNQRVKQEEIDAKALSLTQNFLNPSIGTPKISEQELTEALKTASPAVKVHIFYQTKELRSDNWQANKTKMERSIPIFKALIASDTQSRFHRNYAQLGFALKDKSQPDWKEAEAMLSKAIEIRGDCQHNGFPLYEFNRAICRIKQDSSFNQGKPSSPEIKDQIVSDLKIAVKGDLKNKVETDLDLSKWLQLNNVNIDALEN